MMQDSCKMRRTKPWFPGKVGETVMGFSLNLAAAEMSENPQVDECWKSVKPKEKDVHMLT